MTYDGKPHTINAPKLVDSEGNPLPEDSYTVYYSTEPLDADSYGSGSTTPPTVKDAVNTTIYYYIKSDNYGDFSGSAAVSIAKKELTVTAKDSEISFGTDPVNNGVTCSGFAEGENESVLSGSLSYKYYAKDTQTEYEKSSSKGGPGEYDIVPDGLSSSNYTFHWVKGTMTVTKGQLDKNMFADIAPLDFEVNENGDVKPVQPSVTVKDGFGDIINGNDFDISYEGNGAAGEGKVIITPKANGNFAGSAQIEIPFTIKKKVVTITAENVSSAYNAELSSIGYTVTSNNLNEAEKEKLGLRTETTAVKGSPKGTYETNVIFNDDPN